MQVELDVFSGRPNPVWHLDPSATAALTALHDALTSIVGMRGPAPPGLGYRGFLYTVRADPCRAYRGSVRTTRALLADPDRSIERFFIGQLPDEWASLAGLVGNETGRPE